MARFLAIVDAAKQPESEFREVFRSMRKWRFDKRGWVIKAYCNQQAGKIYIDAEVPTRERFAQWLADQGWGGSEIQDVELVFEASLIWPMHTHATAATT